MAVIHRIIFLLFTTGVILVQGDDNNIDSSLKPPANNETNQSTVIEKNLNEIFDRMLPKIREDIIKNGLDPMSMPDTFLSTTNIPGLRGKIHLQRGWVQQASTVRRTGDVIVQYNKEKLNFDCALGFDQLDVTYAYTLRYLLYKRKGDFHGSFKNVKLEVYGTVDLTLYQVELRYFKLTHVGKFSLKLEGHLADFLLNILTKIFTAFSRDRVITNIEMRFEEALQAKIKEFNDGVLEPIPPKNPNTTNQTLHFH